MRLFFSYEMCDSSVCVKIEKDDGGLIVLRGKSDQSHYPHLGVALDDGEQDRLIEWINRLAFSEQEQKLIEEKMKSEFL